jgi:hypothetical protein
MGFDMKADQNEIDAWLEMYDGDIAAPERSLAVIIERGLKNRIAYVFERAARGCLVKGSVLIRTRQDYSNAQLTFSLGAQMGLRLAKYSLDEAPRTQWDYYFALCDALLAGEFDAAGLLAVNVFADKMPGIGESLEWRYGFSMLLAATVMGDEVAFRRVRQEVDATEKTPKTKKLSWWGRHDGYVELWLAILARDALKFNEQLAACNDQFSMRATDKSLDDVAFEDGGYEDNEYVVDYMGMVALLLARHRGMAVEFDSASIPMAYVRFLNARLAI